MFPAHLKILCRVERGRALDPRVDRVRGDDIEFLTGLEDVMAGVIDNHFDAWVIHHLIVLRAEKEVCCRRNQRLYLADYNFFHFRVKHKGAGRYS